MAQVDALVEAKIRTALRAVSHIAPVASAYLFGSWADGKADRWSDIDLAVFVVGAESWNLHQRARVVAQVQKEAGDEIELHIFPASALHGSGPATFPAWILAHGIEIPIPSPSS